MSKNVGALIAAGVFALVGVLVVPFAILFGGNTSSSCNSEQTVGQSSVTGTVPANAGLFQAVFDTGKRDNRLVAAMLTGSYLESGWRSDAVGTGSYGVFQIQDPGVVHPDITVAEALNPALSVNYMTPAYREALNHVDPALWASNPEQAAEQTAFNAERPKYDYYRSQGAIKVRAAFTASVGIMRQHGIDTDFAASAAQTVAVADISAPLCQSSLALFPATDGGKKATTIIAAAQTQLGVPYLWGGTTPNVGLDCSGLTQWAFARAGITLPRVSIDQYKATSRFTVARNVDELGNAKPGDLVFFGPSLGAIDHVGIYTGRGVMINAPHTGDVVKFENLTDSWSRANLVAVTDPFAAMQVDRG